MSENPVFVGCVLTALEAIERHPESGQIGCVVIYDDPEHTDDTDVGITGISLARGAPPDAFRDACRAIMAEPRKSAAMALRGSLDRSGSESGWFATIIAAVDAPPVFAFKLADQGEWSILDNKAAPAFALTTAATLRAALQGPEKAAEMLFLARRPNPSDSDAN